jgi:periplasmic protein TonB
MFEHAVLEGSQCKRRAVATLAGFAGETAIALVLIAAPVIWPQVLPAPRFLMTISPPAPLPRAPEDTAAVRPRNAHAAAPIFRRDLLMPMRAPTRVAQIPDAAFDPPPPMGIAVPGGFGGPGDSQVLGSVLNATPTISKPLESKPAETQRAIEEPKRVRMSSLDPARLIHLVEPVYPQIAKGARIEGTVELRAVIGTDGRVRQLDVISGHPLLRQAVMDAVRQWIYKPPVLNGESVEIVAPIDVVFRLN